MIPPVKHMLLYTSLYIVVSESDGGYCSRVIIFGTCMLPAILQIVCRLHFRSITCNQYILPLSPRSFPDSLRFP